MKSFKILLLLFFSSFSICSIAQINVYPKDYIYPSEIVLNINQGKVVPGQSRMWNDAVLTVEGNQIFEGWSSSTFDLLYSYRSV